MKQTAVPLDNAKPASPNPQWQALARLQEEIKTALDSHRQFGDLEPGASGARRLMQKVIRRSLTWYTRPNQLFQGAVIRALEDVGSALRQQRDDDELRAALSQCELGIGNMNRELRAICDEIAAMRNPSSAGNARLGHPPSHSVDQTVAPWEIHFPDTATESDILYCFRLLLGRNPKEYEWPGHSIRVGQTLDSLVRDYINSEEFAGRRLLDRNAANVELVQLPKFKMYASRDDTFIGKVIIESQAYEPHVARIFQEYLRPGMVVLDIGANIGYFSLLAASLVGQNGFVYSWEPSSANARMLYASQLVNGFHNIQIVQAAATEITGLLGYFRSSSNGNVAEVGKEQRDGVFGADDVLATETVMGLRIDDFLPKNAAVGFVKIDVEGFEFKALNGAREMLERCRPVIVSEFSPVSLQHASGVSGREYLGFFASRGYDFSFVSDSGPVAGSIDDMLGYFEQSGTDHIDILLRPGSVAGS